MTITSRLCRSYVFFQSRAVQGLALGVFFALLLSLVPADPAQAADRRLVERPLRAGAPLPDGLQVTVDKGDASDPVGDTFGAASDPLDITSISADTIGGDLVLGLTFDGSDFDPEDLDGFFDIDADQNGATGREPWIDALTGTSVSGLGNEFYVDLFTYSAVDGAVDVVDDINTVVVGRAPMNTTASSLTVEIPLAFLGGDDEVNVGAIVGTLEDFTDRAPNAGSVSSAGDPTSILLNDDRFEVSVEWSAPGFPEGPAFVSDLRTEDSGIFYFVDPNNLEFLIKVLDGCSNNGFFWVFFAATTDVEFTVTVTDTQAGQTNVYTNPLGQPADAVTDTAAFATCP